MVAAGILPVAIHKNELYFLFGKENEMEDSSKGFADFGGGVEDGETVTETMLREGAEEMSGFLGGPDDIKRLLKRNGGIYKIINEKNQYHVHIFCMNYDLNLPVYFNNFHKFMWNHPKNDKQVMNSSKLFEKQEIKWFSAKELKTKRREFRSFYREIVDQFIEELPQIRRFIGRVPFHKKSGSIKATGSKGHYTRKIRGG